MGDCACAAELYTVVSVMSCLTPPSAHVMDRWCQEPGAHVTAALARTFQVAASASYVKKSMARATLLPQSGGVGQFQARPKRIWASLKKTWHPVSVDMSKLGRNQNSILPLCCAGTTLEGITRTVVGTGVPSNRCTYPPGAVASATTLAAPFSRSTGFKAGTVSDPVEVTTCALLGVTVRFPAASS